MAKLVGAVHTLARADRRLAATIEQWDTDPMLLNTPQGIVDLRDGTLRKSDPLAFCTKIDSGRAAWRLSAVSRVPQTDHGRRH